MPSKTYTFVAFIVTLAVLAPSALGGEPAGEEVAFAKGLLRRGFLDLAEKKFREMSREGGNPEIRARGELGLIDVLKTRAQIEIDPAKKKTFFDEAIARYRSILQNFADPEALFNLAELLRAKGIEFTREVKRARTEEDRKTQRKEVHSAFDEAIDLLKNFLGKFEERYGGREFERLPQEEQDRRRKAMFDLAEMHFLKGLGVERNREKKLILLRAADVLFEEFIWDYEGLGQAYLAYIYRGRCASGRGETGRAMDHFDVVLSLREPEGASGALKRMRHRLRILAYHRALEALVLAKRFREALAMAGALERDYPALVEESFVDPHSGRLAVLEKAKAYAGLGRVRDAAIEVTRVVDKGGPFMEIAMRLLSEWGMACVPEVGVRILLLQAEGFARAGKRKRAIQAFQQGLAGIKTREEWLEFGIGAWASLAGVYLARAMDYEAGLAYREGELVARRFLGGSLRNSQRTEALQQLWDQGAECAFRAYLAFKAALEGNAGKEEGALSPLKEMVKDQRSALTKNYAESVFARDLHFFAGRDLMKSGKYQEAVNAFGNVDPASKHHEFSLICIGRCHFMEFLGKRDEAKKKSSGETPAGEGARKAVLSPDASARLDGAEAVFREFFDVARSKQVEGEEEQARRRTLLAIATFFMGRIFTEREAWERVVETLSDFEETYGDRPDLAVSTAFLRLRAFARLGRPRAVEDMVRVVEDGVAELDEGRDHGAPHRTLIAGYRDAGKFFDELAARHRTLDPDLRREYGGKAAEYLWKWAEKGVLPIVGRGNHEDQISALGFVGGRLFKAKEYGRAARCFDVVLSGLNDRLREADRVRFRMALGECYGALGEWGKALPVFQTLYMSKPTRFLEEKLVRVHTELGIRLDDGGDKREARGHFDKALKLYTSLLKTFEPEKRQWWVWSLGVWKIMFRKGKFRSLVRQVESARRQYPSLGGPDLRREILFLLDRAKELAGARGSKPRKEKMTPK